MAINFLDVLYERHFEAFEILLSFSQFVRTLFQSNRKIVDLIFHLCDAILLVDFINIVWQRRRRSFSLFFFTARQFNLRRFFFWTNIVFFFRNTEWSFVLRCSQRDQKQVFHRVCQVCIVSLKKLLFTSFVVQINRRKMVDYGWMSTDIFVCWSRRTW